MQDKYLLRVKAVDSSEIPIKITVYSDTNKEKLENIKNVLNKFSSDKDIVDGDYRFSSLLLDMREKEELIVRLMQVVSGTEPYDIANTICETVKHFDIFVHDNIWEIEEQTNN